MFFPSAKDEKKKLRTRSTKSCVLYTKKMSLFFLIFVSFHIYPNGKKHAKRFFFFKFFYRNESYFNFNTPDHFQLEFQILITLLLIFVFSFFLLLRCYELNMKTLLDHAENLNASSTDFTFINIKDEFSAHTH